MSEMDGVVYGNVDFTKSFCLDWNFSLSSNEFVITPMELKPINAPAIEGDSIVPVKGRKVPAATGIPTCGPHKIKSNPSGCLIKLESGI